MGGCTIDGIPAVCLPTARDIKCMGIREQWPCSSLPPQQKLWAQFVHTLQQRMGPSTRSGERWVPKSCCITSTYEQDRELIKDQDEKLATKCTSTCLSLRHEQWRCRREWGRHVLRLRSGSVAKKNRRNWKTTAKELRTCVSCQRKHKRTI